MDYKYNKKKGPLSRIPVPIQIIFFIAIFAGVFWFGYQLREPSGNDFYRSMTELVQKEPATSYAIISEPRDSQVLVIAPHGGKIELYTSTIAAGIAGTEFSLFDFQGKLEGGSNYERLHVSSVNYDLPDLLEMNRKARVTLSVHGIANEDQEITYVGGRDQEGVDKVVAALNAAGFEALPASAGSSNNGDNRANFVNRNASRAGIQLEITTAQRRKLFNNWREDQPRKAFTKYVDAIRAALQEEAGALGS